MGKVYRLAASVSLRAMRKQLQPPPEAAELLSDNTDMDRNPLDLSTASASDLLLEVPDDAWFEYGYRDADGRIFPDPEAEMTSRSIWYGDVSVLTGPDWQVDDIVTAAADAKPDGTTDRLRFESAALGNTRRVAVYTPAGHEGELPLVLVQDGTAFNRAGLAAAIYGQLLAREEVSPARLAFVEPVDRSSEYFHSSAWMEFTFRELLPQVEQAAPHGGDMRLLGTSLGGLASASLALGRPDMFRRVATLSGAFLGTPDDPDVYASKDSWLLERIQGGSTLPEAWFVGTGRLEWLTGVNRQVGQALAGRGVDAVTAEVATGHNWTGWRNLLPAALRHLLPR